MSKIVTWAIGLALLAAAGAGGWHYGPAYFAARQQLPVGFAMGNGRIEAREIDIAARFPGRIASIGAAEGEMVRQGQTLGKLDTAEIEAQIRAAEARAEEARQAKVETIAIIDQRQSEFDLAEIELRRALVLFDRRVVARQRVDELRGRRDTARAVLAATRGRLAGTGAAIRQAEAMVDQLQTQAKDATLTAPKPGRILYRLAEPGEVVGAGGKVLTLLDLSEVYMTVFLPAREAASLALGSEARILLDAMPGRAIPATISFVSAEAQFTPKQVETRSERDRMMYRVKATVPTTLVEGHLDKVKTGVSGVAYVRLDPARPWPSWLESDLTAAAGPVP